MRDADPLPSVYMSQAGLALSPDGSLVAANETWHRTALKLSETYGTTLWDTTTGKITRRFGNRLTGAVAWHPSGTLVAVSGESIIQITDTSGTVRWELHGHRRPGRSWLGFPDLAFSPDGSRLASLGADGIVRLWDTGKGGCAPTQRLDVTALEPQAVSFAPDGTRLAVCGSRRPPEIWDIHSGKHVTTLHDIPVPANGLAYALDGTLAVVSAAPAALHLVSPDGRVSHGPRPLSREPWRVAVGRDGMVAVSGRGDNQVMTWDPVTSQRRDLPRVAGSVSRLAWSPDQSTVYGLSQGAGVMAWSSGTWRRFELPG